MSTQQENTAKQVKDANGMIPITDVIFITLRHWPWILLSVAICVGFAYMKLLRTPDVYTRVAEIQIKDETKDNGMDDFSNMGIFANKTNIQNEVANLRAKDLMEEVVRRLGLEYNFYRQGRFHNDVVYGSELPVKVSVVEFPDEGSLGFKLNISKTGQVTIRDIVRGGESVSDKSFVGTLNDSINTPLGPIVVTPNNYYREGEDIALLVQKIPLYSARNSYNGRLGVSTKNDQGSIIRLTMSDQSTQRADEVLSTLISVYNENWIRDRNQIAVSTSNFIAERLGVIENDLGHVDSDISTYKATHLIPNVDAAASMYMSQNQTVESEIMEVDNQLKMARFMRSYLADNNYDQLLPANSGFNSSNITALISEYNSKLLERNALFAKSSKENPLVKQLDEELIAQRRAILHTVDNEIIGLNTRLKTLRGTAAQTVSKIAANPTQAKNLLSVERRQKVMESLYLFLLQKREENELSQAFTAYNTKIVNKPGPAGVPPTPNRKRTLMIAFCLGLAIPFGFTYAKEQLNTKVRGRKDIEHLSAPFLGEIPLSHENRQRSRFGRDKYSQAVVVKPGKRDVINEAFRVLRTNLEFMKMHKTSADVVAITSFNPGSGKSFLSMNLATALAIKDKKVLIIDGDMRHGSTSSYFDSPEKGLSDLLSGSITNPADAIIADPNNPNLNMLPIGTVPPNPTELLETHRFVELIEKFRGEYDYVLIDCPPIEVVADAQIIDQVADRSIFVIRTGLFERSMLSEIEKIYNSKKFKNVAIILNGTGSSQGRYGYSGSYGYRYGYGYGYTYGGDNKKKKK